MSKILTFLAFVCLTTALSAQTTGTVKGKLVDSVSKQSLKDASITILDGKDSTLEVFGLAKADGTFSLENISFGPMLLQIRFQGYEAVTRNIDFSKTNAVVDLGTVFMKLDDNDLGNVTVSQSPVRMNKDTVEFSASAFKTKPNAVAEDLLKKVPGISVDKDGNVKAQGEAVQRILVDGKRFFGDDPKMATKNLPPDVIDKIQVFDALSDQSAFTGFDDGNRIKTINITTKKDKRKGYFGKAVLGFGANENEGLYDNNFNVSRFNGDQQITLIGQGNNVNKQSFSVSDNLGSLGGGGGGRGGGGGGSIGSNGGGGLVNTWAGGLNYRDTWSPKTQFYGSYFYNDQRTYRESKSHQEIRGLSNPDSVFMNDVSNYSVTHNQNHRINLNFEHQFDSSNSLIIRPNISFQQTESRSEQTTIYAGKTSKLTNSLGNSVANSSRINQGHNANIDATFRHRFAKKGRTMSLSLTAGQNTNDGSGTNYSITQNIGGSIPLTDSIDQVYNSNPETKTYSATISYTEPIAKNQMIEVNYNYSYNGNTSGKNTYSFNKSTGQYDLPVLGLSNIFDNKYTTNRVTLNYRIQTAKLNFSFGSGAQLGDRSSHNLTKDSTLTQHYFNLSPQANFNYSFTKTKTLRIFYNGRTGQPSIDQLQPVTDNSNPLNIKVGNPDLKQQFTHSMRLMFNSFDVFTQKLVMATINASFIQNDIQNSITRTGPVTTTRPVNMNGTYTINGYFNYGFPIKSPKSNLSLIANVSRSQIPGMQNSQSGFSRNTTTAGTVQWTTNLKDNFDMNFSATSTYNILRNTLQPNANADYFTQILGTEATYYTNSGWVLSTDFDYTYRAGQSAGFNTSVPLWNASLSKQMLKNKAGELKFYVFDLLNQNISVSRTNEISGFTDLQSKVLTRYFMVSFTYNLRRFGGPQQAQQRGGQMNNMRGERPAGGMDRQQMQMMRGGASGAGGMRSGGGRNYE